MTKKEIINLLEEEQEAIRLDWCRATDAQNEEKAKEYRGKFYLLDNIINRIKGGK